MMLMIFGFSTLTLAEERATATFTRVYDGETLVVQYAEHIEKVRLIGITVASPTESTQTSRFRPQATTLGNKAVAFLSALLREGDEIQLEFDQVRYDKNGRLWAYVFLSDGKMLNEELLKAGLARTLTVVPNTQYAKRLLKAVPPKKK